MPDDNSASPAAVGLTSAQAATRLAADGPNRLPPGRRQRPVVLLARQMVNFFALMLWFAAALAWVAAMPELAVAIAVVVLLNGGFAFAQEYRADRASERLRDLLPTRTTVRRDGRALVVEASELVVGDVVLLEPGDRVSADLRLSAGSGVSVDESMLTGESSARVGEAGGGLFAGTVLVEGHAEAVVEAVGGATRLAGIASVTQSAVRPPSPLAVQLHRVVRVIALVALGVGDAFFATSLLLGEPAADAYLFAIGATVALVPEGLLPTVTLSLSRAAQLMAGRHALVRRLEAVESLGSTTFICTDKTGTLTRNQMSVVEAWTADGVVLVAGTGYEPTASVTGDAAALRAVTAAADSAARCSPDARSTLRAGRWEPVGDPMDVAVHVLAARTGAQPPPPRLTRHPFDPRRRRSSVVDAGGVHVVGASDAVLPLCPGLPAGAADTVTAMAQRGLQDPPRDDVAEVIAACRTAGIRIAMVTGDHPVTAATIARQVGLVRGDPLVFTGADLPADDAALGLLLDRDDVVVARVTPEDKLRIARSLQGRATFANIRRFLTYHLTDNVAELTPFAIWALSGGRVPLALTVLQVLALDIGTDLLPALALGAEPANPRTMTGALRTGALMNRRVIGRAFGVLGPIEAVTAMAGFLVVLARGGWTVGSTPDAALLATASGTAFAAIVLGQLANAFACRSESRWVGATGLRGNPLLLGAVAVEAAMLLVFLGLPPLAALLGGTMPDLTGWLLAGMAIPAVWAADTASKAVLAARGRLAAPRPV